jgi:hypothetical protein
MPDEDRGAAIRGKALNEGKNAAMSELKLDAKKTAIVVIDLQKGILRMPVAPNPVESVVANCVRLLTKAR